MPEISRREVVLLLLGLERGRATPRGISSITRLQKLLFLLEREEGLRPAGDGFNFIPYKAGPYSSRLYDDLEFLENLGLISSEPTEIATPPEGAEIEALTFDQLIGPSTSSADEPAADAFEERRFRLTNKGLEHVRRLLADREKAPVAERVTSVKSRYGSYSLNELLRYVYTKYPEMAVESEIREQVFRRRGRGG